MTTTPPDQRTGRHTDPHPSGPEAESADGGPPEGGRMDPYRRPPRNAPRWVRWTVVPLLVLVPLVYALISAEQSRSSGETKQKEAAISHLSLAEPTSLQQRIYQVPFPDGARSPGYLETNSWDTSVLYAQFTTTSGGLDTFLAKVGTSRYALRAGISAMTAEQVRTAGWIFLPGRVREGIALHQVGDKPDHDIVVDLTNPDLPVVYVASTVNFQHGFGGGG